ncbi:hypothetical protein ACXWRN_09645, partial [Streptococcus pyogenes]
VNEGQTRTRIHPIQQPKLVMLGKESPHVEDELTYNIPDNEGKFYGTTRVRWFFIQCIFDKPLNTILL